MTRLATRILSAALSAALVLLSPGFEAYAVAGNTASASGARISAPIVLPNISINALPGGLNAPSIGTVNLPDVKVGVSAQLPGASAQIQALSIPNAAMTPEARALSAQSQAQHPISAVNAALQPTAQAINEAVNPQALQNIQQGAPSAAYGAGRTIENVLTGAKTRSDGDAVPTANFGGFSDGGLSFAKPAGDSIREANEANQPEGVQPQAGGPAVPTPPSNNNGGGGNNGNSGPSGSAPRIPFAAKVVSAAIALAPIALVGWPLIAAGSTILGGLVVLGSLGYAAFPFMSPATPKAIRALPGVAVGLLGLSGVVTGVLSGGLGLAAIGALSALGGWGLVRWANKTDKYPDEVEILMTMLGMLGAVAAVGLGAAPVVGLAAIIKIAAVPATLPLLMHLPGWVGETIKNSFETLYVSARQSYRVASSLRRDTSLQKRLVNYSEAALDKSSWNVLWLGLVIWLPVLVSEAVQFVLGVAVGLLVGAIRVPQMAAWTIAHHFAKDSSINKRLAYGARVTANVTSKQGSFNALEKPFVAWANSDSVFKRLPAALGIRVAQIGWLIAAPFVALGATLGAWAFAGEEASKPYDYNLHSPDYLQTPRDVAGDNVPGVPRTDKAPGSAPARILAALVGLGVFGVVVLPVALGGGLLGLLFSAMGLSIAFMPLMPQKAPNWLAKAPGDFLLMAGAFTAFGAIRYALIGLPTWPIAATAIVAMLAGFGLKSLVNKIRDDEKKVFSTDDWKYSLGYVGALGMQTALSLSLLMLAFGGGSPLAHGLYWGGLVSSLALLAHLPEYLWKGLGVAFEALFDSVGQAFGAFAAWHQKTKFSSNYMKWMGSMIKRWSVFVAPALIPFFVPILAAYLVELAASLVVGLTLGVYHFPWAFAWGSAYNKDPKSKYTRFWAGFNKAVWSQLAGSRKTFLYPFVEKFEKATSDAAETGRPTLKAYGGLFMTALGTTLWLARTALAIALTPILLLYGVIKGFQRMGQPSSENTYEDGPSSIF